MVFTYDELIALENPYESLSDADALAENRQVLNALNPEEKNIMATKIIANCPAKHFKNYLYDIQAIRTMHVTQELFYSVISEAYEVRKRIEALLDPRNKKPHYLFLDEANFALFHRFPDLAQRVLSGNESAIAERFALCPEHTHSQIATNMDKAFSMQTLNTKLQTAFTLHHNITYFLLGPIPEQFFNNHDFSIDICAQFANLCRSLLKDHEEEIGIKLAASPSAPKIMRQLNLLSTEAFDQNNPFRLIALNMSKIEKQNANSWFQKPVPPEEQEINIQFPGNPMY